APPPEEWMELLERIIQGGKLCQLYLSAKGALKIVQTLGGKGFLFTITDEMTAEEAESFLHQLEKEDISR
ncbi:MAG: hypothetical protein J7M05_01830, partial [Anaerolineae bacterium]|nr:hypothetical protein [Anaerolineae bacterium]